MSDAFKQIDDSPHNRNTPHPRNRRFALARHDNILNHIKETVNLSSILNDLVQLDQPQAIAKEINLKSQLTEKLYLLGDLSRVSASQMV